MASKRYTPLDDPPSASSDGDETEDDEQEVITQKTNKELTSASEDEEEEEEDESEEDTEIQNTKIIVKTMSKPAELSSEEESESEEEEEERATPVKIVVGSSKTLTPNSSSAFDFDTDTDLKSPSASDFAIKPSKKVNTEKISTSKRLFSESDLKKKKKIKVSNGEIDDEKKTVVKRVWSDDDEILLLEGFLEYQSKKGCSPLSDMDGFYQFTMENIPGTATKSQLYEKIRRMKKKFRVNSEKVGANGRDPRFFKPHDTKMYEVSKKIWGINGCESIVSNTTPRSRAKPKPKIEVREEEYEDGDDEKMPIIEDFETLYPYWNTGLNQRVSSNFNLPEGVVHLVKDNMNLIGEEKAKEMDEKWEKILLDEADLARMRIKLLNQTDLETTF